MTESKKRKLELVVLSGVSAGDVFRFELGEGESMTIGRSEQADMVLSDPTVSRTHAGIIVRDGQFQLQDLGSASGTTHMGFSLTSGAAGARAVQSGDEFKVGSSLFRVQFEAAQEAARSPDRAASGKSSLPSFRAKFSALEPRKKRIYIIAGVASLLLLVLLLLPEEKKGLPKQVSDTVLEIPELRLLGYWPGNSKTPATNKDSSRLDKVQFYLPTSDAIIEYEYITEADVAVFVDGQKVNSLLVSPSGWRRGQVIARDVLEGRKRTLVFDNLLYPSKTAAKPIKRWGVKNVRVTPISRTIGSTVDQVLAEAAALAPVFDKAPDGLFRMIRLLQRCALEQSSEIGQDAVGLLVAFDDSDSSEGVDGDQLQGTLQSILSERRAGLSPEQSMLHLEAVADAISKLDGELWRRVNSRFRQATFSAQAKNSIVVYDNLVAVKAMFPDSSDLRWIQAETMLNDKKMVPKNVLKNPGRYRK